MPDESTAPGFRSRWNAAVQAWNLAADSSVDIAPPAPADGLSPGLPARDTLWGEPACQSIPVESRMPMWANAVGCPYLASLDGRLAAAEFVQAVPIGYARQMSTLGLTGTDGAIELVCGTPDDGHLIDTMERLLNQPVQLCFAPPEAIRKAINAAYEQEEGKTRKLLSKIESSVADDVQAILKREDLLDSDRRAPVIRLVNHILFEAVQASASDVHVQPSEVELVVRFRIDGALFDVHHIPKALQDEVLSRLKVVGGMDIAEKRLPQDGRATVEVGDRVIDLRMASLPTNFGERVVIRLLDKSARVYRLAELGYSGVTVSRLRQLITRDYGLFLVTGPTGSGKSTTLYAALQEIDRAQLNVVTIEDPIEYQLDGVSQTQVNTKKGLTFASGLRSVLRQDPDIIMVGEIRDRETAEIAIQSALTGHLVFSTLHTNDAASAVTRLLDLGVEPYLVASCLVGVLAQRLVRRNCPACSRPAMPTSADLAGVGLEASIVGDFRAGPGCAACRGTGFRGRFAICELLSVTDAIRTQIQARTSASNILRTAVEEGLKTIREDGLRRVLVGETTVPEITRVTVGEA